MRASRTRPLDMVSPPHLYISTSFQDSLSAGEVLASRLLPKSLFNTTAGQTSVADAIVAGKVHLSHLVILWSSKVLTCTFISQETQRASTLCSANSRYSQGILSTSRRGRSHGLANSTFFSRCLYKYTRLAQEMPGRIIVRRV